MARPRARAVLSEGCLRRAACEDAAAACVWCVLSRRRGATTRCRGSDRGRTHTSGRALHLPAAAQSNLISCGRTGLSIGTADSPVRSRALALRISAKHRTSSGHMPFNLLQRRFGAALPARCSAHHTRLLRCRRSSPRLACTQSTQASGTLQSQACCVPAQTGPRSTNGGCEGEANSTRAGLVRTSRPRTRLVLADEPPLTIQRSSPARP